MSPPDRDAPGWEHGVIYALDARNGREIARRPLPDPVPVAAMAVEGSFVHVIATRRGEPVFWYVLGASDLAAKQRRIVELRRAASEDAPAPSDPERDVRHDDVLDVWAAPDGGIWLELEGGTSSEETHTYAFVALEDEHGAALRAGAQDVPPPEANAVARDACAAGRTLFAPLSGLGALYRLEPEGPCAANDAPWARAEVGGSEVHAMTEGGVVSAFAVAEDPDRPDRALVQAFAVDPTSGVERWKSSVARVSVKGSFGETARLVRRSNGELLFQRIRADGTPCTDLVCARPDGSMEIVVLGNGRRPRLDAALGELVLAHCEGRGGRVTIYGFEIDRERLLLGRRGTARWTIDTEDLGGGTNVYAGAGHIVVRGASGVAGIRV
jgi:hypothetical protein